MLLRSGRRTEAVAPAPATLRRVGDVSPRQLPAVDEDLHRVAALEPVDRGEDLLGGHDRVDERVEVRRSGREDFERLAHVRGGARARAHETELLTVDARQVD